MGKAPESRQHVFVAAAGDAGVRGDWWPGQFEWVMGVGALDSDKLHRAAFTNWGGGVEVYAPGTGLVNAFVTGTYVCHQPPHVGENRHFYGRARCSSTSFAASTVAGLIAARMSRTGEVGKKAAESLLKAAQAQRIPEVGPVLFTAGPGSIFESSVFISYRRDDSGYAAGWLYERLAEEFGKGHVFKDVYAIPAGDEFAERIAKAVWSCDVLLALIGKQWLKIADKDGRRRIDDPEDFVRLEVATALGRGIPVIPILLDQAQMPRTEELPSDLANLTRRQAVELSSASFDTHSLAAMLERIRSRRQI